MLEMGLGCGASAWPGLVPSLSPSLSAAIFTGDIVLARAYWAAPTALLLLLLMAEEFMGCPFLNLSVDRPTRPVVRHGLTSC